jgi:predicted O-methyltransferase YrrM
MSMAGEQYPNWFSKTAQPNFEQHLLPLAGQPNLKFLQLGAYTGDATEWLMNNILTSLDSTLQDVDTWRGSDEEAHETIDFEKVYGLYLSRIRERDTVYHYRRTTFDFLIEHRSEQYDFIYVDADHTTVGVLLDAELSWPLLKSGGIMAFDDYTWGDHYPMHQRPKPGIDLFLLRHSGEYDVLAVNLQYWIRKH